MEKMKINQTCQYRNDLFITTDSHWKWHNMVGYGTCSLERT